MRRSTEASRRLTIRLGAFVYHVGMGLQRFPLGGFLGGMNLVDNPYSLKSGEAQRALDVDIGLRNVLASRKGFTGVGLSTTLASQTKSASVVENDASIGNTAWTNVGNAKSADNSYAKASYVNAGTLASKLTNRLKWRDFGFSLPAGAIVVGVSANLERKSSILAASFVRDFRMDLYKGGVVSGTGHQYFPEWKTEELVIPYGSSEDLWGIASLTKTDVEKSDFAVGLAVSLWSTGGVEVIAEVDSITLTVWYTTEGIGADAIDHIRPWYVGSKRNLMISANGKIKRLEGGKTGLEELFAGTAGTTWCFEQMEYNPGAEYKDSLWAMNGTDAPKKWDGTTFTNWGGKPPNGTMLRVWKNMMIVAGHKKFPQRLFFSDIANPESPEDETNGGYGNRWIDVRTSEDDLDPITWLEIIDDVLLVFKKRSVNAIFDSTDFAFQRIANVGCEGRFQSCVVDDRCYFVNRSGVYSVTANGSLRYESLNIEPLFKGTGPEGLEGIDLGQLATSARMASLPNGRVYLACTPAGTVANRWLLEAYPRMRGAGGRSDPRTPWVKHSFAKRCVKSMCTYRTKDSEVDKVVAGMTNEAGASPELVSLFESVRDGLEPISWQWRSGYKSLIAEEPYERVRRVNLLMKGKLIARMITDGEEGPEETLESEEEALVRFRPEARGKYHALDLRETGQIPTHVYEGEFALRGGKEH